jgi:hypothetical protein
MATLHQLHLPDDLLAAIGRRAKAQGITIEEQVRRDLARAAGVAAQDEPALLDEIRRDRQAFAKKGVYLTEAFLQEAKRWGRE